MVYEESNDFSVSSSLGFKFNNSSSSGSKGSTWNIPKVTPSAPPYPGSEEEFDIAKGNTNPNNSYNFFFINDNAAANAAKEPQPYWKYNPIYEKQAKRNDIIEGVLSFGAFFIIFCIGVFFTTRLHKRSLKEKAKFV